MMFKRSRTISSANDISFRAFAKRQRRTFSHDYPSLNSLSSQIEIGIMKALYPDSLLIESNAIEKLDQYDYDLILINTLSPFLASLSEGSFSTQQLKELVVTMLEKYEILMQFAKNNLLPSSLVNFANNLTTEQALVLFSDYGPGIDKFIHHMSYEHKQMYLALAAAVDSVHITQHMLKPEPDGVGIIPGSDATTVSFLASKPAILASFLSHGGVPKLSNAIMNASHMLNRNALVLLRDSYYENVDSLIKDGSVNALVAAMTTQINGAGSNARREPFLNDILQIKGTPSLIDAKVALNHGIESIVREFLAKSTRHEYNQFIESAHKIGKGEEVEEMIQALESEKYKAPAMR